MMSSVAARRMLGASCLAVATTVAPGCFLKQSGAEVAEVDPYAPAAPPSTEPQVSQASANPVQGEDGQNTGSDQPVPVDAMMADGTAKKTAPAEEKADPVTRDYSQAFDPDPGYKPAAPLAGEKEPAKSSGSVRGQGGRLMVISVSRINIRTSPDRKSRIVGELRQGDKVMVDLDEAAGWAKLSEGEFIRARHLKSAEN